MSRFHSLGLNSRISSSGGYRTLDLGRGSSNSYLARGSFYRSSFNTSLGNSTSAATGELGSRWTGRSDLWMSKNYQWRTPQSLGSGHTSSALDTSALSGRHRGFWNNRNDLSGSGLNSSSGHSSIREFRTAYRQALRTDGDPSLALQTAEQQVPGGLDALTLAAQRNPRAANFLSRINGQALPSDLTGAGSGIDQSQIGNWQARHRGFWPQAQPQLVDDAGQFDDSGFDDSGLIGDAGGETVAQDDNSDA